MADRAAAAEERALLMQIARLSGQINSERVRRGAGLRYNRHDPHFAAPAPPAIRKPARRPKQTHRTHSARPVPSTKYVRGQGTSDVAKSARTYVRDGVVPQRPVPQVHRRQHRKAEYGKRRRGVRKDRYSTKSRRKRENCRFFVKFGMCKNGGLCKYAHDKSKVRICPAFVRGKCEDKECLLQHKLDQDMMPVCWHYLRGVCTNEKCPYSHVYVNMNAGVCLDFVKGSCPLGSKCQRLHALECQAYRRTGYCADKELRKCPLQHRGKGKKKNEEAKKSGNVGGKEAKAKEKEDDAERKEDSSLLPSFLMPPAEALGAESSEDGGETAMEEGGSDDGEEEEDGEEDSGSWETCSSDVSDSCGSSNDGSESEGSSDSEEAGRGDEAAGPSDSPPG